MKRLIFIGFILGILGCLAFYVGINHVETPQGLSFETLFRYLGQPVKTVDRSITRALGVNAKDERELGAILAQHLAPFEVAGLDNEKKYVNDLIYTLAKQYNPKNLSYHVYIFNGPPNAFAVPGGNIVVTTELLSLLDSEAELVAILGHEKGHIDLGHCIDHMRIQAKTYRSQGQFIDWYVNLLFSHAFSKFQENESDQFGFETLIALEYDPSGLGDAFTLMQKNSDGNPNKPLNPIRDYFMTHPSLAIRAENWTEKAKRWKAQHDNSIYYVGKENYKLRTPRSKMAFEHEWQKGNP